MSKVKRRRRKRNPLSGNRVLIRRPPGLDEGVRAGWTPRAGEYRAWEQRLRAGFGRVIHPIVRLTDDGPDWGAVPQPGDLVGYGMHPYRGDDCLAAAVATVTQIPIEQVPDPGIDKRLKGGEDPDDISSTTWKRLAGLAASHGLRMAFHDELPTEGRWVAVVAIGDRVGDDHCLVMHGERVLFDVACSVEPWPGFRARPYTADDITYGITFEKEE